MNEGFSYSHVVMNTHTLAFNLAFVPPCLTTSLRRLFPTVLRSLFPPVLHNLDESLSEFVTPAELRGRERARAREREIERERERKKRKREGAIR
jgi:hypothetical protein